MIDPLGGINTLWPLFGISNQMLAGIALMLGCVVLIRMKRQRYVWVTLVPAVWLLICTTTAGLIKLLDPNPAMGFTALANKYSTAAAAGGAGPGEGPSADAARCVQRLHQRDPDRAVPAGGPKHSLVRDQGRPPPGSYPNVPTRSRRSSHNPMPEEPASMFNDLSKMGKYRAGRADAGRHARL